MKISSANLSSLQKVLLQILGYSLTFVISVVVFIFVLFPYSRWKGTVEETLSRKTGKEVKIEKITGWHLIGIKLKSITISDKSESRENNNDNKKDRDKSSPLFIDSAALRPLLIPAIRGRRGICFNIKLFGGDIGGNIIIGNSSSVDIEFDDIKMEKISKIEQSAGIPVYGKIKGKIKLKFPKQNLSALSGKIKVKIKDAKIGDKNAKLDLSKAGGGIIKGAMKIEPIKVGEINLKMEGKEGVLSIKEFKSSSPHFEFECLGQLKVRKPLSLCYMNLYLKFKFKEAYIQKSPMTKSIFSTLDRLTKFRQAKRPDGFWGFAIKGTISRGIHPVPARREPSF